MLPRHTLTHNNMNTTDILDNDELAIFIENLRLAGYDIGTTELFRAQDLLVALAAQGKLPSNLADMKTLLMPILCHSPKEQEDFDWHFTNWAHKFESLKTPEPKPLTFLQALWQDTKQAIKNLKWFLSLALIVFLLLSVFPNFIDVEEPAENLNPIPEIPLQPITPTLIDTKPDSQYWWWVVILLSPILFAWLFWYLWLRNKAQPYLTRKSTSQPPNIKQLFAKNINEGLFQSVGLTRVAQQLRKHTSIATDALDLKATIKHTIKAGGWFTPVTGYTKIIPEYLVLIDRSTFKDHQTHLIDALINQLITQGVFVARYYFDGDPRHCYPENDELPPQLLTELADQYPTHRLLMFAESDDFIDPITGESVRWIEQFSVWHQKTFFTLEQPGQWGYPEKLLEQANFLIRTVPINENDLTTLAEQIKAEIGPQENVHSKPKDFSHYPAYFNEFSHWWLERHAPARPKITELLNQVRTFLGADGYYWFSACAVYPELRWHLTLYLGYRLKTTDDKPLLSTDNPDNLAKLASLPWFRYGYMPNWLRKQLIKDLPLPQEDEVRIQLKELLDKADKPISDFQLEIATPPEKKFSVKELFSAVKQRFSSEWKKQAPKNSLRDYVFVTFMSNKLSVKIPKMLRSLFIQSSNKFKSFPLFLANIFLSIKHFASSNKFMLSAFFILIGSLGMLILWHSKYLLILVDLWIFLWIVLGICHLFIKGIYNLLIKFGIFSRSLTEKKRNNNIWHILTNLSGILLKDGFLLALGIVVISLILGSLEQPYDIIRNQSNKTIAYIDHFNAPAYTFRLKRNGQELDIYSGFALKIGDEIFVIKQGYENEQDFYILLLFDGRIIRLNYENIKNKPYQVTMPPPPYRSRLDEAIETIRTVLKIRSTYDVEWEEWHGLGGTK
jgi:hypothetical protein